MDAEPTLETASEEAQMQILMQESVAATYRNQSLLRIVDWGVEAVQ